MSTICFHIEESEIQLKYLKNLLKYMANKKLMPENILLT